MYEMTPMPIEVATEMPKADCLSIKSNFFNARNPIPVDKNKNKQNIQNE